MLALLELLREDVKQPCRKLSLIVHVGMEIGSTFE